MSDIIYRIATLDDLDAVLELAVDLFEYESGLAEGEDAQWPYSTTGVDLFAKWLSKYARSICYLAETNGRAVGYIAGGVADYDWLLMHEAFEIQHIFVKDEYRGHGVGRQLLELIEKEAVKLGAKRVFITEVLKENAEAQAFYEKLGYGVMYYTFEKKLQKF